MPDIQELIRREVPCTLSYRPDLYGEDGFLIHFKYRPEIIDAAFLERMSARAAMVEGDSLDDAERAQMSAAAKAQHDSSKTADGFDANMELIKDLVSDWDLTSNGVRVPIDAASVREARIPISLLNQIVTTITESINAPKNGGSSSTGSSTEPASLPASISSSEPAGSFTARPRRGR